MAAGFHGRLPCQGVYAVERVPTRRAHHSSEVIFIASASAQYPIYHGDRSSRDSALVRI